MKRYRDIKLYQILNMLKVKYRYIHFCSQFHITSPTYPRPTFYACEVEKSKFNSKGQYNQSKKEMRPYQVCKFKCQWFTHKLHDCCLVWASFKFLSLSATLALKIDVLQKSFPMQEMVAIGIKTAILLFFTKLNTFDAVI